MILRSPYPEKLNLHFADDFNRVSLGAAWQVLQGSVTLNGALINNNVDTDSKLILVNPDSKRFSDGTLQAQCNRGAGIMFRVQDANNYYALVHQRDANTVLYRYIDGIPWVLAQFGVGNTSGLLKVVAAGPGLTIWRDEFSLSPADVTYASGHVGIYLYTEIGVAGSMDSFQVDSSS